MTRPRYVAFDTETTGLFPWKGARPFAVSFCHEDFTNEYYEWPVDPKTRQVMYEVDSDAYKRVREILEDDSLTKVGHNIKFDIRMMEFAGIQTYGPGGLVTAGGRFEETMFAAHAMNALEPAFDLKTLAKKYAYIEDDDQKELHRAVQRARRWAAIHQPEWQLGDDYHMDFWLPTCVHKEHAEDRLFPESEFNPTTNEEYCVMDAIRTMILWKFYSDLMNDRPARRRTYDREIALWPVIYEMEKVGVAISSRRTQKGIRKILVQKLKCEKTLYTYTRGKIKLGAGKDLCNFLYGPESRGGLGLPVTMRTPSGRPAMNQSALETHISHPFVESLLKYRACDKSLSSFYQKFYAMSVPDDKFSDLRTLHADFRQVGPVTGRVSCRNPNLMNVTTTYSGRGIFLIDARDPFVPREDCYWYCIDYKQLEVRLFAECAKEQVMIDAILSGRSIHWDVTNRVYGGPDNPFAIRMGLRAVDWGSEEASTDAVRNLWSQFGWKRGTVSLEEARRCISDWLKQHDWDVVETEASINKSNSVNQCKMVTFLKIYGGGPKSLSDMLKCDYREAVEIMDTYDETFPDIANYIEETSNRALRDGYIVTLFGDEIPVPSDKSYRGVNYTIQGSAARLIKLAMIKCVKYIKQNDIRARMLLQLHDELVFEFHKKHALARHLRALQRCMSDVAKGYVTVPIDTDIEIVRESWREKHEVTA